MWYGNLGVWFLILCQAVTNYAAPTTTPFQPEVQYTSSDPNEVLWNSASPTIPQPERAGLGAPILGPHNIPIELQNPDLQAGPTTDNGNIKNFKWSMSASHTKLKHGGWTRQQNVDAMPIAQDLAGVNMRLAAGSIRELHWHTASEWGYVLKGDMRVSTITPDGDVWVGDVSEGDIWYFPAGNPHSLQAKDTNPQGVEILLIFDEGNFSEDSTFQLTDWLAHVPKSVVAKNFGLTGDLQAFDHIPQNELYIFPSLPPAQDVEDDKVVPNNTPFPYTYQFSKMIPEGKHAGTVKVVDSRTFQAAQKIAAAEVRLEVGGLRELHWHPTEPEWTFFLSGEARITLFASQSNAATYDFSAGDVAYIPPSYGHYIENIGNTTLVFIEVLKTDRFQDISLAQWLALTPSNLVKAHLGFSDETIAHLNKNKLTLVK